MLLIVPVLIALPTPRPPQGLEAPGVVGVAVPVVGFSPVEEEPAG